MTTMTMTTMTRIDTYYGSMALMEAKDKNCDWTDEKYIEPLVDYVLKNN